MLDGDKLYNPIYIPLCFYFIGIPLHLEQGQKKFTFHYASTLSNKFGEADTRTLKIYIPLCFYFIGKNRRRKNTPAQFTFHYASTLSCSSCSGAVSDASFTFHYASTLSLSQLYRCLRKSRFTFHYASTLSKSRAEQYIKDNDIFTFHYASTLSMSRKWREIRHFYLHSTMLLLYRAGALVPWRRIISFTFHYACK